MVQGARRATGGAQGGVSTEEEPGQESRSQSELTRIPLDEEDSPLEAKGPPCPGPTWGCTGCGGVMNSSSETMGPQTVSSELLPGWASDHMVGSVSDWDLGTHLLDS